MLAAAVIPTGAKFVSAQNAANAASSWAAVVPRLQPTPSTPMRGIRCKAFPCGVIVRAKSASDGSSASATPAGGMPAMAQGEAYRTVLPASSAPLTNLMRGVSHTAQFCFLAHSSTANRPLASVAVVITGTAPQAAASRQARSFAPPRWPESSGTAKRPHSSSTTTAGSVALLWQWGAMARTAMPAAPTNTRASAAANCWAVHPASVTPPSPQRLTEPGQVWASCCASASPLAVKARYAQFTVWSPRGIRW